MDFIERLEKLLKEKGVSASRMCLDIGLSKDAAHIWKKRNSLPTSGNLKKIADYFGVSTSYLLGETPAPNVTEPEQRIEAYDLMPGYGYSDLDDEDKAFVEQQQKLLVEQLLKKKGQK